MLQTKTNILDNYTDEWSYEKHQLVQKFKLGNLERDR